MQDVYNENPQSLMPEFIKPILNEKKFFIKTFGCQMNVADTERMSVLLAAMGASPTENQDEADIVILNGCEVREKAVNKALSKLGTLKESKKQKNQIIGIGGCVGQLEGAKLFKNNHHLDFVFGTDQIDKLPILIEEVLNGNNHIVLNDFDKDRTYTTDTFIYQKSASAFVNIMKGCDKFCSYCIVPFTRGREKSRKIKEIVNDVQRLVLMGVKEVTLLGQNVNSFGKGNNETFPELLYALDEIKGLKRIRYTSSHPLDFTDELIECYGKVKSLAAHLHLPVQSGSNRILQKMHRHYKIEKYIEQIEKWKARCPHGGLTTDMIVGFPTETDEDFKQTMDLIERIRYDMIYAFAYSPRPGTKAARMTDDVPDSVKNERLVTLQKRAVEIANEINQKLIGKTMEILVEGKTKTLKKDAHKGDIMWTGRTECNKVVNFEYKGARDIKGQFLNVEIISATGLSLTGKIKEDFLL
jgi:tRNA-2-methylthio-N6-dimethylallyladenosine synthase